MSEQIYVFPLGDHSNARIFEFPGMAHEVPDPQANCYFGKTHTELPIIRLANKGVYRSLCQSTTASFFAFVWKGGKNDNKQYFNHHNVNSDTALTKKLLELVKKIPKEEIPKLEEDETSTA